MTRARGVVLASVVLAACGIVPPGPDTSQRTCESVAGTTEWKTERSYTRGFVPRGSSIELGLEGRPGTSVRATVKAPDGSELTSTKTQEQTRGGAAANYVVRYPRDFAPEGVTGALAVATPGTYAVRWEASGTLAACDKFEVARTGVADAQPCAPGGWTASAPFGSSLSMRRGNASVGIAGDQRTLGVVSDPWYVFEPNAREDLALPDGSKATLRVSRSAKPRRVSAEFRAGDVPYRFDATADGVPDLLELSRAVVVCAQQRLAGNTSATAATRCVRAGGPAPTTDPRPEVFPPTTALRVGETQQFVAAHQEAGCFDAPASVTWTLSPPSLGTITPDGVFTAREAGTGTVTATTSGFTRFTGSASVRVDR